MSKYSTKPASAAPPLTGSRMLAMAAACGVGLAASAFMGSGSPDTPPERSPVATLRHGLATTDLGGSPSVHAAPMGETRGLVRETPSGRDDATRDLLRIACSPWMGGRMQPELQDQEVVLRTTKGRAAIDLVLLGEVEAALFTGALSKREIARGLTANRVGDRIFVLGVGRESKLRNISREMIDDALSGSLESWAPLGGSRHPLGLIAVADQLQTELAARVLMPGDRLSRDAQRVVGRPALREAVIQSGGLGLAVGGLEDLGELPQIRLLRIDGVLPNVSSYRLGNYPFGRGVHLVTQDPDAAQKAMHWLSSDEGQAALWACCIPAPMDSHEAGSPRR